MAETLFAKMQGLVPELNVAPDEWLREMMRWHFSDETGSPYWIGVRRELEFNPLTDVKKIEDLALFGLFDKSFLRSAPTRDLVPRGLANMPRRIFETGGTSGSPCRIVDVATGRYNVTIYRAMLDERGLSGGDVLAMTPSGPHAYGTFVKRLADTWQGNVFAVDFDPRWVKQLLRNGSNAEAYVAHLVEQTHKLLETQQPALLFTTSKLLMALVLALPSPMSEYGVRAVCTGGTSCTEEEEFYLRENFLKDIVWIDTYGNTLMGHALQGDPWSGNSRRAYYLPPPQSFVRIVDPHNWRREMPIGERGRVLLQTLHRDLFIPNLLERDCATRTGPHPWFPFDGVADIGPYIDPNSQEGFTEGVY